MEGSAASSPGKGVLDYFVPAVTALGVLLYGAIKFSYYIFYTRLGIDPDDLGLGYQQILSRSALLLALIVALGALVTAFFEGGSLFSRERRRGASKRILVTFFWAASFWAALIFISLPIIAIRYSNYVKAGGSISSNLCNVSGLRAQDSVITWRGPGSPPDSIESLDLKLLGEHDGQAFFYVVATADIIRLPTNSLIVRSPHEPLRVRNLWLDRILGCRV